MRGIEGQGCMYGAFQGLVGGCGDTWGIRAMGGGYGV